jgi:predicted esterase YcpF (UPF0227 family)
MKIVYLHGFQSSPHSRKAIILQTYMQKIGRGDDFIAPFLPFDPKEARVTIEKTLPDGENITLVGSSLGGFYATYFAEQYNLKAVLINPAVHAHQLITPGYWKNELTGEETYFTPMMQEALAQMDVKYLSYPERFFLLIEKGDEVLDYRQALAFYEGARQIVLEGGDHSFTRFDDYLDAIIQFTEES